MKFILNILRANVCLHNELIIVANITELCASQGYHVA